MTKGDYYLVVSEKTGKKSDSRNAYTLIKKLIPWQAGPGVGAEQLDGDRRRR